MQGLKHRTGVYGKTKTVRARTFSEDVLRSPGKTIRRYGELIQKGDESGETVPNSGTESNSESAFKPTVTAISAGGRRDAESGFVVSKRSRNDDSDDEVNTPTQADAEPDNSAPVTALFARTKRRKAWIVPEGEAGEAGEGEDGDDKQKPDMQERDSDDCPEHTSTTVSTVAQNGLHRANGSRTGSGSDNEIEDRVVPARIRKTRRHPAFSAEYENDDEDDVDTPMKVAPAPPETDLPAIPSKSTHARPIRGRTPTQATIPDQSRNTRGKTPTLSVTAPERSRGARGKTPTVGGAAPSLLSATTGVSRNESYDVSMSDAFDLDDDFDHPPSRILQTARKSESGNGHGFPKSPKPPPKVDEQGDYDLLDGPKVVPVPRAFPKPPKPPAKYLDPNDHVPHDATPLQRQSTAGKKDLPTRPPQLSKNQPNGTAPSKLSSKPPPRPLATSSQLPSRQQNSTSTSNFVKPLPTTKSPSKNIVPPPPRQGESDCMRAMSAPPSSLLLSHQNVPPNRPAPMPVQPSRRNPGLIETSIPSGNMRELTPSHFNREPTPSRLTREPTPSRTVREPTPSRADRARTPSRTNRDPTPSRSTRGTTPSGARTPSRAGTPDVRHRRGGSAAPMSPLDYFPRRSPSPPPPSPRPVGGGSMSTDPLASLNALAIPRPERKGGVLARMKAGRAMAAAAASEQESERDFSQGAEEENKVFGALFGGSSANGAISGSRATTDTASAFGAGMSQSQGAASAESIDYASASASFSLSQPPPAGSAYEFMFHHSLSQTLSQHLNISAPTSHSQGGAGGSASQPVEDDPDAVLQSSIDAMLAATAGPGPGKLIGDIANLIRGGAGGSAGTVSKPSASHQQQQSPIKSQQQHKRAARVYGRGATPGRGTTPFEREATPALLQEDIEEKDKRRSLANPAAGATYRGRAPGLGGGGAGGIFGYGLGGALDLEAVADLGREEVKVVEEDEDENVLASVHALKESGEMRRFVDEMTYTLDGVGPDQPNNVRQSSCIDLSRKFLSSHYVLKLRAHNFVLPLYRALVGTRDPLVLTALAFFMCTLAEDRRNAETFVDEGGVAEVVEAGMRGVQDPWMGGWMASSKAERSRSRDLKEIIVGSPMYRVGVDGQEVSPPSLRGLTIRLLSLLLSQSPRAAEKLLPSFAPFNLALLIADYQSSLYDSADTALAQFDLSDEKPAPTRFDFEDLGRCMKVLETVTLVGEEARKDVTGRDGCVEGMTKCMVLCQGARRAESTGKFVLERATETMVALTRVLMNISADDEECAHRIRLAPRALSALSQAVLFRPSDAEEAGRAKAEAAARDEIEEDGEDGQDLAGREYDVIIASLCLLINIVSGDTDAKNSLRYTMFEMLVEMYHAPLPLFNETERNLIRSYIAFLLGTLCVNNLINLREIRELLPGNTFHPLATQLEDFVRYQQEVIVKKAVDAAGGNGRNVDLPGIQKEVEKAVPRDALFLADLARSSLLNHHQDRRLSRLALRPKLAATLGQPRTMIDITLLRAHHGGNPEIVRESQRRRGASVELVDELIKLDEDWRKADECNKEANSIQKEITALHKAGKKDQAVELVTRKDALKDQQRTLTEQAAKLEKDLFSRLALVGNIVHSSVPTSLTEDDNVTERMWWPEGRNEEAETKRRKELVGGASAKENPKGVKGLRSHHEVLEMLGGYEPKRGQKVAGHRAYFLTGAGVDLNFALLQYGLDFLNKKGYTKVWTPFFMKKEQMARTAQLSQFDEELYKVVEGGKEDPNDPDVDNKYLIATAEQPISAFHSDEWLLESDLPKRYAGVSTCFRKEAGAAGRDTWGVFRVHQFEKVEQFCVTEPTKSWDEFDSMIQYSEEFYKSLGIPFRVVSIVSGALNNAAAKKYDLEAWFPFQCEYRELVSCSNCTDYQSRSLEVRWGTKKLNDDEKRYVHMLNSTLCATERAMCCVLENFQTEEGLVVPEVLRPYMQGRDFIPFIREVSVEEPSAAASKKAGKGSAAVVKKN
ncbi:Cytosolic seryl-tRNA synthetase [Gonapodya sp. JEL0774]|nr:Cytosolic seryl-tRNA synthetase [Gonapodya sp. JEL0774]